MTAPADSSDIAVTGDATRARDTVANALTQQGFALTWADEWNGTATKGSKTKQRLLGAFGQYFEVGIVVFGVDGGSVVRLTRPSAGISGGLAGRQRAANQFTKLAREMRDVFGQAGVLRAV